MISPAALDVACAWGQVSGTREYQEDAATVIRWPNGFHLLLLADGMGGHQGGAKASRLLIESIRDSFGAAWADSNGSATAALVGALQVANLSIYHAAEQDPALAGMGATLVAATIGDGLLEWLSVGDSLLLLLREGQLTRLNADHSMAPELAKRVATGEMTEAEALQSPLRSELLTAVNGEDITLVDISKAPRQLRVGDVLIVASDGLNALEPHRLTELLNQSDKQPQTLVESVLDEVGTIRGRSLDNTTLIAVRIGNGKCPSHNHESKNEDA